MSVQTYVSGDSAVKIAGSVEQAVASGRAAPGQTLPAVRSAAQVLGVSPATVAAAYKLLRDRGVVVADGRRGTRIRGAALSAAVAPSALPADVRDLAGGNPDPALLPDLTRAVRKLTLAERLYGDDLNDPELIELAASRFKADNVPSHSISVAGGALDGIERVLREHLRPGDRVIVEDPCFTGISDMLAALALNPVPVRVDDEGLDPDALRSALRRAPEAMIVTPRAQNPSGAAISARRARVLRSVLRGHPEVLLIEDDHAAGVAGQPYETLVDASRARWATVRSVAKALGPDVRLAVMASDSTTASRIEHRQRLGIRWVSHVLQRLVVALWRDRGVTRLLGDAEAAYRDRRDALIEALRQREIAAHGRSGLNVWIPVPEEAAVVQALLHKKWAVQAGERYRIGTAPAIRITTAALQPKDAGRLATDLADVLRPRGRTAGV
jgi:DNA-binding transcriptional MocR family regulator